MGRKCKVEVDIKKLAILYKPKNKGGYGLSLRQIGEKIGISHEQVRVFLAPLRVVRKHKMHHITPGMARAAFRKHHTYEATSKALGIANSHAYSLVNNKVGHTIKKKPITKRERTE